ncbi:MAG: integrase arm-type DNA-binding domain-containing protein [Candidatus Riflebacteria bacterium]|nr:integrase arm-type DNA-binding domain-containing protein [Candidatus Riflebacteria bacterium]
MALSDTAIRMAKPRARPVKMFDADGLFLLLRPTGARWWRFRYRFGGGEKLLSLGTYPEVSLKEARSRRDEARRVLAAGIDPSAARKADKAARETAGRDSFQALAEEWLARRRAKIVPAHAAIIRRRFDRDLFPAFGAKPITDLAPKEILAAVRRIEARGAPSCATRALWTISQVCRYAVQEGRLGSDPCRDLRGAIDPPERQHFAAITDPKALGRLLRALETYDGTPTVKTALRLAPLLVVRPGELVRMEWGEVNLDTCEWRYLVTKTRTLHVVPLCRRAVELLREIHPLTGGGKYVFPNARTPDKPMTREALRGALADLGFGGAATTHGWRAVFRTLGDEVLGFRPELLEHQLAHAVRGPLGRAYDRTTFLPERKDMMERWAQYLSELAAGETRRASNVA